MSDTEYRDKFNAMDFVSKYAKPISRVIDEQTLANVEHQLAMYGYVKERTCHIVKNSRKYVLSDGRELFDDGCSICNGYVGDGDNYCSNCGARVVSE